MQTPNRLFFIEPHVIAPFIHWLPFSVQRRLVRHFTVFGWVTKPDQDYIDQLLGSIRLLSESEMKALFPDATILREKFLFFTKSLIAVRL